MSALMNKLAKPDRNLLAQDFSTPEMIKQMEYLINAVLDLDSAKFMSDLDYATSSAVFSDVPGALQLLDLNSAYLVEAELIIQSSNTGVGIGLGFTLPAGATIFGQYQHFGSAGVATGSYNIASGTSKANSSGVATANENVPVIGRWVIKTGATVGNAQLQLRSSSGGDQVTLKADSTITFRRIG